MTPEKPRPDPVSFLVEARTEAVPTRDKLKIFLGAAPGVGKTYAMLEEARARPTAATTVLAGMAETHGRTETAAILSHLEPAPRRIIAYRGKQLSVMDLAAILARKPQLVLIDELAHLHRSPPKALAGSGGGAGCRHRRLFHAEHPAHRKSERFGGADHGRPRAGSRAGCGVAGRRRHQGDRPVRRRTLSKVRSLSRSAASWSRAIWNAPALRPKPKSCAPPC